MSPVVLRRVFGLTYPNATDVRFSHISSSNALHRTLMCSHVVLTSCCVSVNVVCVSPCVQGRAVSLSLVDMWCVVECVACHWVSSGDGVGGHVVDTSPFSLVGTLMSLGIGLVSMHFRLTP